MRQVHQRSEAAWLIDLTAVRGPYFVVLRSGEDAAVERLVHHLVHASIVPGVSEAQALLEAAVTSPVEVVW